MGKLIVIEGTDGSGKSTQFQALCDELQEKGQDFHRLQFPQYKEPSSALIRMYLGGELGDKPGDVNGYAASTFYAVDRYASYVKIWGDYYEKGGLILCDRYTGSNAIHQAGKISDPERGEFFDWLSDLEYKKMGLPAPDLVICLDMPTHLTCKLMRKREQETDTKADIHEQDTVYLAKCRDMALQSAEHYGWTVIPCNRGEEIRSIDEIHQEIMTCVKACLEDSL